MRKFLFLFSILPLLYGCPPPCDPSDIINNGLLSDEALALCPYQNKSSYKFKHSNGYVVDFSCERTLIDSYDNFDYGCGPTMKYESSQAELKADYPKIQMSIFIENRNKDFNGVNISIGRSSFVFYHSKQFGFGALKFTDSLKIEEKNYYNVLKLTNNEYSYLQDGLADSIYYNQEYGIIKMFLKNGESYTTYHEN